MSGKMTNFCDIIQLSKMGFLYSWLDRDITFINIQEIKYDKFKKTQKNKRENCIKRIKIPAIKISLFLIDTSLK